MTRQLRQGKGRTGLILANGGVMSYQHVLCLSTSGRQGGLPYPTKNPLPECVTDLPVPTVDAKVEGSEEATIEVISSIAERLNNSPTIVRMSANIYLDIHGRVQTRQHPVTSLHRWPFEQERTQIRGEPRRQRDIKRDIFGFRGEDWKGRSGPQRREEKSVRVQQDGCREAVVVGSMQASIEAWRYGIIYFRCLMVTHHTGGLGLLDYHGP